MYRRRTNKYKNNSLTILGKMAIPNVFRWIFRPQVATNIIAILEIVVSSIILVFYFVRTARIMIWGSRADMKNELFEGDAVSKSAMILIHGIILRKGTTKRDASYCRTWIYVSVGSVLFRAYQLILQILIYWRPLDPLPPPTKLDVSYPPHRVFSFTCKDFRKPPAPDVDVGVIAIVILSLTSWTVFTFITELRRDQVSRINSKEVSKHQPNDDLRISLNSAKTDDAPASVTACNSPQADVPNMQ